LGNSNGSGDEKPEHLNANLSSEPSGSNTENVGDAKSGWTGRGKDKDIEGQEFRFTRTGSNGNLGDPKQLLFPTSREHGAMDEASGIPTNGEGRELAQADSESSPARKREGDRANASECNETQSSLGGVFDVNSVGVGVSELSGLSDSELEEIRKWMVRCDNRTDELRLLGNGVCPPTATRAFLTLFDKLK
jgi:hypothetical protein